MEVYLASDGEHLCSIDYKSRQELKPALKGRNVFRSRHTRSWV
ncbi:hypothetical protein [Photorhabdus caribbeanensis]